MTVATPPVALLLSASGFFQLRGVEYPGSVAINGENSAVEIYGTGSLELNFEELQRVIGVAKDGTRITALNCVGSPSPARAWRNGEIRSWLSWFPNMVVTGSDHVDGIRDEIGAVCFTLSQANNLFYDQGAFNMLSREHRLPRSVQREMLKRVHSLPRRRRRGGRVEFMYHWDRGPIIEIRHEDARIAAYNSAITTMPSSAGIQVTNKVVMRSDFERPRSLRAVLGLVEDLRSFCELMIQSHQNLESVELYLSERPNQVLTLYLPNETPRPSEEVLSTDALINGGFLPDEFESVLSCYLASNAFMRDARRRFIDCFRQGNEYNINRLIGAANAFDLLPSSAFNAAPLPDEVAQLVRELEQEIREKSDRYASVGEHKDQLLNAVGRIRGMSLRSKVRSRFLMLADCLKSRLPGMEHTIRACILVRNHFVHGSDPGLSAEQVYEFAPFFTDTLEFIFAASDLAACGWNTERWVLGDYSRSKMKSYMSQYRERQRRLTAAVASDRIR